MNDSPPLQGRIALVTGATSGFGLACARSLVRAGARVIAGGRRADRLAALASELAPAVFPLPLDVRDGAAVQRALSGLPADLREVDVLVNNAGLALGLEPAQRASLEQWEAMIATNCTGAGGAHARPPARDGGARPRPRGERRLGGRRPTPTRAATSTAPPRPSCTSSRTT